MKAKLYRNNIFVASGCLVSDSYDNQDVIFLDQESNTIAALNSIKLGRITSESMLLTGYERVTGSTNYNFSVWRLVYEN